MTLAEKYARMTDEELEEAWRNWHRKAGQARREVNSRDDAHRQITLNIEAVDTEVERRGLDFEK